MKIGFIGLGTMGSRLAARLQETGHELVVHDIRRSTAEPLLARGAQWAGSPCILGKASEVVFTSLPGPLEVDAVALGAEGLLSGMAAETVYIDLSTNAPTTVRRIHAVLADRQIHMLDAPLSGGPRGAASGNLAIWVGGEEEIFDRYRNLLHALGDRVRYVGGIGAGSIAKLVHNGAGYCMLAGITEMFTVGVKAGVDPLALWEAIRDGNIGRRRSFDGLIDQILPGKYQPAAFALRLAHKDTTLAAELGRDVGVPLRMVNLALAELTEALNHGWGDLDSRAMTLLQQERAGLNIEVDPKRIARAVEAESVRTT